MGWLRVYRSADLLRWLGRPEGGGPAPAAAPATVCRGPDGAGPPISCLLSFGGMVVQVVPSVADGLLDDHRERDLDIRLSGRTGIRSGFVRQMLEDDGQRSGAGRSRLDGSC